LLLGQAEHDAPFTDARADMPIDILGAGGRSFHPVALMVWVMTKGQE
jgi:hypothetical protein